MANLSFHMRTHVYIPFDDRHATACVHDSAEELISIEHEGACAAWPNDSSDMLDSEFMSVRQRSSPSELQFCSSNSILSAWCARCSFAERVI
jgi:hypothetical protein